MDLWKQPAKGRQQQHLSHKSPTVGTKSDQNSSSAKVQQQPPSDPNQAIANVLNHHHNKIVQNKKKNQQKQEEQKQAKQTVKLDQSPRHHSCATNNSNNNLAQPQQVSQRSLKKASSASQDSGSSSASTSCSHKSTTAAANTNNQVDQGNSYLYAYNDFVTSTAIKNKATLGKELDLACGKQPKQEVFVTNNNELHESLRSVYRAPVSHLQQQQEEREFQINQADCLLESDEDDALSYILHQHRSPHHELLHDIQHSIESSNQPCRYQRGAKQTYLQAYDEDFEAHRIDHHLSCSRSSHPRHICGIGGSHNDNLNHIAARLREESQRAFALNQRSSLKQNTTLHDHHHHNNLNGDHDIQLINNDIAAIQSHQFTHDLTVLHNQLANGHSSVSTDNQYHHHHHHQLNFHTASGGLDTGAFLATTASDGLHTGGGREHENLTFDRKQLLLDSAGDVQHLQTAAASNSDGGQGSSSRLVVNDTSDLSSSSGGCNDQTTSLTQEVLQPAHGPTTRARQINSGYFNWLLCSFGNFLGAPIKQQHQHPQSHLQRFAHDYTTNAKSDRHQHQNQQQQLSSGRREAYEPSSSVVSMYNTSQQSGQLGGQPGAYYATQTSQGEVVGMHSTYSQHAHHLHHHHQHHYPLSSDSSLGSSGPFASSALKLNNFFRQCCSKKCFFVSCLMLILLIFIVVIGLTAYLNFLINLNKTNLTPLSGRLRVDNQADQYSEQLANRTSKEFLAKQQQYETILRGAFDRTQNLLKSYPNHLVKCEVYAFKPGSLWVYFRLFINKRTLLLDNQLMKRKSPEEHVDKHFLPRLTQQTLHSGFEQLVSTFNRGISMAAASTGNSDLRRSRSSQTAELRQPRTASPEARSSFSSTSSPISSASSQRDHVKSFDDQISRLMPIIESIDLQTILVTPDFDMLQSNSAKSLAEQPPSMSDGLLASQPLTTTPSTLLVATGPSKYLTEYDIGPVTSSTVDGQAKAAILSTPTLRPAPQSTTSESGSTSTVTESSDGISVVTRKFTITGYKENTTRPVASSRPTVQQTNSLFLVNQTQRKPPPPVAKTDESSTQSSAARQSNTVREISTSTGALDFPFSTSDSVNKEKVVGLKSGKPLVSQNSNNNNQRAPSRTTENSKLVLTTSSRNSSAIFAPTREVDQIQAGNSNANASHPLEFSSPASATVDKVRNVVGQKDKMTNEKAAVMQMVAPYQKMETSTGLAHDVSHDQVPNVTKVLDSAIQDLWNNAIGNKKNGTNRQVVQVNSEQQTPKRLITVTTIGANNQDNSPDSLDWNKISILPLEITNTIRTQINQTQPMQSIFTSTSTSSTTMTPVTLAQNLPNRGQKPKVSPLANQGGSIISTAASRQQDTNSAIVLSKDLMQSNNLNINSNSNNNVEVQLLGAATNSTQQQMTTRPSPTRAEKLLQKQTSGQLRLSASSTTTTNTTTATTHAHVHAPTGTFTPANNDQSKRKVSVKLPKVKKVSSVSTEAKNGTQIGNQPISSKGIRIVDDFLATIESSQPNRTAQVVVSQNSRHHQQQQHKNKTLEPFNYNVDQLMPTTIDLIRSVTSSSFPTSTRTSSSHQIDATSGVAVSSTPFISSNADYTTTSPSTQKLTTPMTSMTEIKLVSPTISSSGVSTQPSSFVTSNPFATSRLVTERQQSSTSVNRPTPTTNFSNQWKPITNSTSEASNSSSSVSGSRPSPSRKPNVSFIGNEKLSSSLVNVPSSQGSQSPFAMSPSILENQLRPNGQRASGRLSRPHKVTNSYQATSNSVPNEFESHRVSRMRQGESSPSSSADSFGTTETSLTTAEMFSEPKTRYVDDFMITTDKVEPNARSTTILPPLTVSSSSTTTTRLDHLAKVRTLNPLDQVLPKRTRGPFAFETLKSVGGDNKPQSDISEVFPGRSERSASRLASGLVETVVAAADHKLLVRKKLFLGNGDDEELSASSTSNPPAASIDEGDISKVRPTSTTSSSVVSATEPTKNLLTSQGAHASDDFDDYGNRRYNSNGTITVQQTFLTEGGNLSFRCQYYGCKAKGSLRYTCLNYTQVCDDFIDCQDESDELDCVSLLKHDSKSNKLSFSNGGGIIYLNRKGSLAPMCIDYYTSGAESRLTSGAQSNSPNNEPDSSQMELAKKQQELIKQINTIGQYACSLQSFSRLVSVKINHHDLVDSLNLIKTSKLYHRLSIIDSSEGSPDESSDNLYGTYKSGSAKHEVELTTSPNCPSQRTVFVKCGSFDCGQYSFTVMDKNNNAAKGKDGVIINDFPWLVSVIYPRLYPLKLLNGHQVKLYWMGALSCHGYLIDELWLISSSECFANRTTPYNDDSNGWTAEISYEHYGNNDYQSIESNRRSIQDILVQPAIDGNNSVAPSIVLAKLEKPVRFSPLNRPICLPLLAINKTSDVDRTYQDCVTATLPMANTSPTQDILLSKVKVSNPRDCLLEANPNKTKSLDNLICVGEQSRSDVQVRPNEVDSTRVLICSTTVRSRSKWTVVGVQNKAQNLHLAANKQLFTTVLSQLDWIVDTMNPKSDPNLKPEGNNLNGNELNPVSSVLRSSQNQTCNRFKCSSGECLSWSRICDGLYDCSSHEDEKDCHK